MPITTTGSSADGYDTVANADSYHSARGNTAWADAQTAAKEAAIREATQFIDANFRDRFSGYIRSTSQALEWPRVSAVDRSGRTLNGIPTPVKHAMFELALAALSAKLDPVQDRGGQILSRTEQVGPVRRTLQYAPGAPKSRDYSFAESILSAVLVPTGNNVRRVVRV